MPTSLETMMQDLRYAIRQMRKTPGFALVAVVTLALGIGANTAVFSVMNAVLLASLPVRDPQQLVYLHTSNFPGGQTGYGDTSMRMQVYEGLRKETRVFSDLMAWVPLSTSGSVPVRYGSEPEEARGDMVSGNFFSGLGVSPARGRIFTPQDEQDHTQVVIFSYNYWTRRFARNPSVLGGTFFVKGVPFTVVGIAPPQFVGLDRGTTSDFWVPFQTSDEVKPWGASAVSSSKLYGSRWWFLLTIGRLQPGVSPQQAQAYLNPIFQSAAQEGLTAQDKTNKPPDLSFSDTRGMEGTREGYETPLRILLGMVGLVLVIACGNVSMLLVARNAARGREFALRMALGGTRTRLFRQLLTESMLLVLAGATLGWFFALWATRALARWSLLQRSLAPDARVLLFTLAVSLVAALAFGLAPLRSAVRVPMGLALKTSSSTSHQDRGRHRSGQIVIALQMALCLVLLIGAGLLVRTMKNVENIDLGLRPSGLLVFGVNPQQHVHNPQESRQFFQALLDRMRTLPGVESATVMTQRLGAGWSSNTSAYVDGQLPKVSGFPGMRWNAVGPDWFHVLGIPLRIGRDFKDSDTAAAPNVVIVNETFVKRYLPDTTPLGHTVAFSDLRNNAKAPQYTIIGVAADAKYTEVLEDPRPMAYFPYTQVEPRASMELELHTIGNPEALMPTVRRAMAEFAPDLPLLEPMTQQAQFDQTLSSQKLFARLASFFGLLAVLLVSTGLYGTLAYKVARRSAEIGVRMALGAQRRQVLWLVLRESLFLCLAGVLLGFPAAFVGTRLLKSMLFGLSPSDPVTFIGALAGVAIVALAASFVPARRAASVDPIVALRCE